ncbi:bifunctional precorrin-2 dehydrogenase/sirohydrochlorin ferrochelatase [Leptospira wolffii]|uniref:precorrin-2 dehydrogenase/sirohydrochlorin ferrochelatase family protein n=1 Tax=Leptospira wolffii TaxID=409998 RepID=UPI00034CC0C2|nr:bifunctional precorrin-2 dehydrogenase/sirohydrochlorin ferrochelatase [Leptospira wolffii]TGK61748.1 bifunctional precorrin-2 dehydrogenase/sirohydrochlorin ferrochelatase [Leptospira wolffii]TGK70291.1 bifunctional precorrin-2 dehydrogenase/sirohydrochlorin ferrochelatase [Leptospira wolffii]TGK77214.1 bifunctional precorrin-2 dehydrogenase/sirohydrochlorin ferrochelatase [Leptospira wolffii]TGL30933.1 bifunctional precorrin-2 dehydrogenase/sirohydrochlorin ferrochelatase [Leptospira wolff
MSELLPAFLKLDGKRVLVVGGGNVALEKLQHLLKTGCDLTVISKQFKAEVSALLEKDGTARKLERAVRSEDLDGYHLVYSATNDSETNRSLVDYANRKNIWINCVDDPRFCDFYSAAYFDRGPIRVAFSTQGKFAGLAGTVRTLVGEILPEEHDEELEELLKIRELAKVKIGDSNVRKAALKGLLGEFREKYLSSTTKS